MFYIPSEDARPGALLASSEPGSVCEFKGMASYYDAIGADGRRVPRAGWRYHDPSPGFEAIKDSIAVYPE